MINQENKVQAEENPVEEQNVAGVAFGSSANGFGTVPRDTPFEIMEDAPLSKHIKSNFNLCFWSTIGGLGMFTEAYYILGFGNIKSIWKESSEFHNCFLKEGAAPNTTLPACNVNLTSSLSYLNYAAMMFGMLTFGYLADKLGRRWGSTTNVSILLVGAILGTAASGGALNGEVAMFLVGMLIIGYAVGAEYPLAATSAAERAEKNKDAQPHVRGKGIAFTFAMQGIGNLACDIVLICLLAAYGCTSNKQSEFQSVCTPGNLNTIWRLIYGIGLIPVVGLIFGRFKYLKESEVWKKETASNNNESASLEKGEICLKNNLSQSQKFGFLIKHYWHRLVGTALGWLVWDFAYYGAKGYNGTITKRVLIGEGNPSLWATMILTLEGQIIQCLGYYLAALVVDKSWMGRTRLQMLGFFVIALTQLISWVADESLSTGALMALYFICGFFQQFGPNTTTWLLPAELFPTELRALSHGISAGTGKLGAIISGVVFSYGDHGSKIDAQEIYLLSFIIGLIGVVLTFVFIPNVTKLDLQEQDKRWKYILAGKEDEYNGEAINPKYLSFYERITGVSKYHKDGNMSCLHYFRI